LPAPRLVVRDNQKKPSFGTFRVQEHEQNNKDHMKKIALTDKGMKTDH